MYVSKKDAKIIAHFNLTKENFFNTYVILLDEPYRMRFNKIDDLDIYAENLSYEDALFAIENLKNDSEIIENNIKVSILSTANLYRTAYMHYLTSLKRIESIKMLRELIANNNPIKARLIFNRTKSNK